MVVQRRRPLIFENMGVHLGAVWRWSVQHGGYWNRIHHYGTIAIHAPCRLRHPPYHIWDSLWVYVSSKQLLPFICQGISWARSP